ncbi:MAG TPA: Asp-tRNA(Asn)/Glu-tRNA(Gln) amidotransferase subunit GatC [Tissierellaceae bacterium]
MNKDEVLKLAELAMIEISEQEAVNYSLELSEMVERIENIKNVNTDGFNQNLNINNIINPLREDIVTESLDAKEVLKNTKENQYGYFKILNVMD